MKLISKLPSWINWGLAFPLVVLNGWLLLLVFQYFKSLITIFIIANLLAFILNYGVELLASKHLKRSRAVLIVVFCAILVLSVLGITLAPVIIQQLNELATRLPSWIQSGIQQLQVFQDWAATKNLPLNLSDLAIKLTERLSGQLQSLTGQVLNILLGTVGSVFDLILTLVLTFYLLLHGEELWDGIYQWFPQSQGTVLRQLLRQNFQNYYIGQASLAAIVGISMTLAFLLLQAPLGLLFGLAVGFMTLFPFGLSLSIAVVSLLMALKSFWLGLKVLAVAILLQQIIENGIAPRLLGGFTGLNPVWILLALLIGAKVGGLVGVLIAVPVAGFLKSASIVLRESSEDDLTPETEATVLIKQETRA